MTATFLDGSKLREQFLKRVSPPPPPPPRAMFFDRSKFREQFFEKGHPRNNPVKSFQNVTSGFRGEEFEEFL